MVVDGNGNSWSVVSLFPLATYMVKKHLNPDLSILECYLKEPGVFRGYEGIVRRDLRPFSINLYNSEKHSLMYLVIDSRVSWLGKEILNEIPEVPCKSVVSIPSIENPLSWNFEFKDYIRNLKNVSLKDADNFFLLSDNSYGDDFLS